MFTDKHGFYLIYLSLSVNICGFIIFCDRNAFKILHAAADNLCFGGGFSVEHGRAFYQNDERFRF